MSKPPVWRVVLIFTYRFCQSKTLVDSAPASPSESEPKQPIAWSFWLFSSLLLCLATAKRHQMQANYLKNPCANKAVWVRLLPGGRKLLPLQTLKRWKQNLKKLALKSNSNNLIFSQIEAVSKETAFVLMSLDCSAARNKQPPAMRVCNKCYT